MPSSLRLTRIGDRFLKELSEMLVKNEIRDPRLYGITITEVKVDRELSYADIYVSAIEGVARSKEVLEGLESASGFIRKSLSDRMNCVVFQSCGSIGTSLQNVQTVSNNFWHPSTMRMRGKRKRNDRPGNSGFITKCK
jgi:ribosome-binding factor A